ncbi:hypothetical protein Tco_0706555 [Tanacetum coccineum]|uniref:Uncharacterized protein n=1 Tax=Tanacetum coccineum TaxID=301880 RepID=A0ABQ4Y7Q2_9ASTR
MLQQFWATASLKVINGVPHIRAKVACKKDLISEATIRCDLLFDDENGVDCFPKQVIWDLLRDIGYEGNLAQLTFSKPLFSPQWKYLVHVLLHCLVLRAIHGQFGSNIASALVGSTIVLNKQLEGVDRLPPDLNTILFSLPFLRGSNSMAAEEEHSTSPHSRAAKFLQLDASRHSTPSAAHSQRTASVQGTASFMVLLQYKEKEALLKSGETEELDWDNSKYC